MATAGKKAAKKAGSDEPVLDIKNVDEKLLGGLVNKSDESPETPPQFQPAGATEKEAVPKDDDSPVYSITEDGVAAIDLRRIANSHPNDRSTAGAYWTKLFRRFEHDPERVLHEIKRQGGVER